LIVYGNIVGGLVTQIILELLFVWWALWVAWSHNVLPQIHRKSVLYLSIVVWIWRLMIAYVMNLVWPYRTLWVSALVWIIGVWLIVLACWTSLKQLMKWLSQEEILR
jgi:hypothetical protein